MTHHHHDLTEVMQELVAHQHQSTIALGSGESEFYALTRGAALGLSLKSLMADWGQKYDLIVLTDSSAARGTAARRGLGKLRHAQARYFWVQERVANNDLTVKSLNTKQNLADLCTKPVSRETCEKHMGCGTRSTIMVGKPHICVSLQDGRQQEL